MAHQLDKKWRSEDVKLREKVDFSVMLLSDRVLRGLDKAGFKVPSPIQLEAIPIGRFGKDLLVQAKSGTGKTLVFTVIALEMLRHRLFRPQVLILAPTREIATQICSVVQSVGASFHKLTCNSFIGGLSLQDDKDRASTCQIVVGTPGRIKQLINLGSLPTNSIRLLILDEADQLFHGTFKLDIDDIFQVLPSDKQVIATSATFPVELKKIIFHYLRDPFVACINSNDLALCGIVHYTKLVPYSLLPMLEYRNKLQVLEKILTTLKFSQCLIFCNMIGRVEVLCRDIKRWGFSTSYISSAKEQAERLKVLDRLKHFKCKILVSSDVTSRGIDAENVDLVINFDLALSTETYLHRVGRAGRYGSIGLAISIITDTQLLFLKKMEDEVGFKSFKLPDPLPKDLLRNPTFDEYTFVNETHDNLSTGCHEQEDKISMTNSKHTELASNGNKVKNSVDGSTFCKNMSGNHNISGNDNEDNVNYDETSAVTIDASVPSVSVEDMVGLVSIDDKKIVISSEPIDEQANYTVGTFYGKKNKALCECINQKCECVFEAEVSEKDMTLSNDLSSCIAHEQKKISDFVKNSTQCESDIKSETEPKLFNKALKFSKNKTTCLMNDLTSTHKKPLLEINEIVNNEDNLVTNSEILNDAFQKKDLLVNDVVLSTDVENNDNLDILMSEMKEECSSGKNEYLKSSLSEMTTGIQNVIRDYEARMKDETNYGEDADKNTDIKSGIITMEKIKKFRDDKNKFFYQVLKKFQGSENEIIRDNESDLPHNNVDANNENKAVKEFEVIGTEKSTNEDERTDEVNLSSSVISQLNVLDSLEVTESKPVEEKLNLSEKFGIDLLVSKDDVHEIVYSVEKPKHQSTPGIDAGFVFETLSSSEESESGSELSQFKNSVSSPEGLHHTSGSNSVTHTSGISSSSSDRSTDAKSVSSCDIDISHKGVKFMNRDEKTKKASNMCKSSHRCNLPYRGKNMYRDRSTSNRYYQGYKNGDTRFNKAYQPPINNSYCDNYGHFQYPVPLHNYEIPFKEKSFCCSKQQHGKHELYPNIKQKNIYVTNNCKSKCFSQKYYEQPGKSCHNQLGCCHSQLSNSNYSVCYCCQCASCPAMNVQLYNNVFYQQYHYIQTCVNQLCNSDL